MSERIEKVKPINLDKLPAESGNRDSKPQNDFREKLQKAIEERRKRMAKAK